MEGKALYTENLLIVLYYNVRLDCEKFIFSTQTEQNKKDLLSKLAAMPKTLNNSSNLISCRQVCKRNITCTVMMMYATEVPETNLTNQAGDKMFRQKKNFVPCYNFSGYKIKLFIKSGNKAINFETCGCGFT